MHFVAVPPEDSLFEIDFQATCLDYFRLGEVVEASSSKHRPQARGELAEHEWLGDVIVRTGFQGADFVVFQIANGDHHDAGVRGNASDPLTGGDASDAGHVNVQQD